jgi:RNA polymerase-binding transcription factor
MPVKSPFTAKELKTLKDDLQAHRVDVERQLAEISENTFAGDQTDMTGEAGFDEEYADAGSATYEREKDLSLVINLRDLQERIEKAVTKIDEGTYGLCDRCGKPIEKARLKALPYANLCLKDKQAEERVR